MRLWWSLLLLVGVYGQESGSGEWCADTSAVVLTDCDDCSQDSACIQYGSDADASCNDAAGDDCNTQGSTCTYQCVNPYNILLYQWMLFVNEPRDGDARATAPIDTINSFTFPENVERIQITGFGRIGVQKGSVKTVDFDSDVFESAKTLGQLALINLDLSAMTDAFVTTSVSSLFLVNCKIKDYPINLSDLSNLRNLNLSNNDIASVPSDTDESKVFQKLTSLNLSGNALDKFDTVIAGLTTLDLRENSLTEFPSSILNMSLLESLYLDGNSISSLTVTSDQAEMLNGLSSDSTLGVQAASGSCPSDTTERKIRESYVCVSDSGDDGGSNNLLIVLVVVAAVVVLAVFGAIFFFCRRKKSSTAGYTPSQSPYASNSTSNSLPTTFEHRQSQHKGNNEQPLHSVPRASANNGKSPGFQGGRGSVGTPQNRNSRGLSAASAAVSTYAGLDPAQMRQNNALRPLEKGEINPDVLRIPEEDLNFTRVIAKGSFGEVWLAQYDMQMVAVKKLLLTDEGSTEAFIGELNLLSSLHHSRVMGLYGACWKDDMSDLQIVTEYMDSGDLLSVLREVSGSRLPWEGTKGAYCCHISEALYYLHSRQPPLIHRDIKSRNILVDSHKGAKISDFGESRQRTVHQTMTGNVGTARWVAPELILGEMYSESADVYSFGVLLTELDTHRIPFADLQLEESTIVQKVALGKLKPKVSDSCPEVIRRLTHECLQFDPHLRPTAERILNVLLSSPLAGRGSH